MLRRLNPAVTVVLALLADAAVAVVAALFYGLPSLILLGLTAGLAQALAKLSLDSTIQRDVPSRIQASAFARSDTTLQLAWVIGGFIGIAMPLMPQLGLGIAAGVLGIWATFVLISRPPAPGAGARLVATSDLELVGEGAQHLRRAAGGVALGVATVAVALLDALEHLDEVLDDGDHRLGLLALGVALVAGDRGGGVEDAHLEGLVATPSLRDAELDLGAGLERRGALGQRIGVDVDVRPSSCDRKPNPLSTSNHFTLPLGTGLLPVPGHHGCCRPRIHGRGQRIGGAGRRPPTGCAQGALSECTVAAIMGGSGDDTRHEHRKVGTVRARQVGRIVGCALLALGLTVSASSVALADDAATRGAAGSQSLTLVTLQGPGTSAGTRDAADLLARQDALLAAIGAGEPTYRWTTALNGFAARLTAAQLGALETQPGIAAIEPDAVRPLAGRTSPAAVRGADDDARDSGWRRRGDRRRRLRHRDRVPAFADVPGLGPDPQEFAGACAEGDGWSADDCTRKIVGARWFVDGFGADRIRSSESLSAQDVLGHGTQVSSVAAGNAGVSVRVDGRDAGQFGGVAPQARIAAYKACWGAPDPADDGCSTADVVTAVDAAVADRVDVLSLALAGGEGIDTLQRALLGAAEADIVVIGAAGNSAGSAYAAHASPWVTTVGSAVGRMSRGRVTVPGGRSFAGGGRPARVAGRAVLAQQAPAPGVSPRAAGQCRRGALDSRQVAGRIVVCRRGGIGRIDKSENVALAGGRAMVLVNLRPGSVTADFHAVPTVHLSAAAGRTFSRWVARHPDARIRMSRVSGDLGTRRTAPWSAAGDPRGASVKPDAVADGDAVLGALPDTTGRTWGVFSGSSAAAAHASGLAALVLGEHDWSASVVRSLVASSARPMPGSSVLVQGAGALPGQAPDGPPGARRADPRLASCAAPPHARRPQHRLAPAARAADDGRAHADQRRHPARVLLRHRPRLHLARRRRPAPRRTPRAGSVGPLHHHGVGPATPGGLDDGELVWLGARGGVTRVPVALTR